MSWDFVIGLCTVAGGISAIIAIYQFTNENILKVHPKTNRHFKPMLPRFLLPSRTPLQFRQEMQERAQRERENGHGTLLVYTSRTQLRKEAHICKHRHWALRSHHLSLSAPVQCFRYRVNKHRLFIALFKAPAGSYIVWIGKAKPVVFFKRPTTVSIFPGKLTELFLR